MMQTTAIMIQTICLGTFTFEYFSRCCYPEQLTGAIRVGALDELKGTSTDVSPIRLGDSNQQPFD
jgi:hypothetical protein